MKAAVIGAGYWGIRHVEKLVKLNCDVLVADLREEILRVCKEKYNVKTTKDYKDILKDDEIKAVIICIPNEYHYEIAKQCLESGKNVLVEKPITINIEQGEELVGLAESKNLVLSVGHIFRFNNAIKKIKEMIDNKEFGEIYCYKARWISTMYKDIPGYIESKKVVDVIFDMGPHSIDILYYLTGKQISNVSAVGGCYHLPERTDVIFINCRVGRIPADIELSWVSPPKKRELIIIGSEKSAFVDCVGQKIKIIDKNKEEKEIIVEENDTILERDKNFLEASEMKNPDLDEANGKIGLEAVKRIIEIQNCLKNSFNI